MKGMLNGYMLITLAGLSVMAVILFFSFRLDDGHQVQVKNFVVKCNEQNNVLKQVGNGWGVKAQYWCTVRQR